jgi:hypothetical protein
MADDESYTEAARKIVEGYEEIIGEAATGVAERNEHTVYEDGKINEFKGGKDALEELVDQYKETIGNVALRKAKSKLDEIEELKEEDLPEELR